MNFPWKTCFISLLGTLLAMAMASNSAIAAISISDSNLHVDRGVLYSNISFLTASGGVAPYIFSVASGIPAGITVRPTASFPE